MEITKQALRDKVKVSVFALEYDSADVFQFSILHTVKRKNDRIDFSVLLSIKQKERVDTEAVIRLIKLEEGEESTSALSFTLNSFSLSPEQRKSALHNSVVSSGENPKFKWDPYEYNDYLKLNFRNVPVVGAGYYAVAVCVDVEDSTLVLDKQYFQVD